LCVVDAAGTVWFKNDDRHDLMRFDGETFEEVLFVPNEDHPTDAFFTIDLHPNGVNLIVGATNVVEYDGTEWHIMPAGNYEPYNLDIMYDDEGRVWTTGSNMMYFAPPEPAIAMFDTIWHVIKTNDLGVRRFAYDRNDGVWCRCHDGSLRHYALSDSVWSTVPLPEEGTGITELTTEPSGRLWIGSTNGVYVKPVGGEVKGTSLTGCSIREIAVGPDSTVWFATDDGLWSYDPPHNKPSGVGGEAPADFGIDGNYPNPFNPSTTLSFTLDKGGRVTLEVYNITGQKVRTLAADEYFSAGSHDIVWDGCDDAGKRVSSGVYLARISMGGRQAALAMTLLK
jgi:streptogramin lyase